MWSTHKVEYYSAVKRNEAQTHTMTWINLENSMLSEKSQTQKPAECIILCV